jgi:hypothetical protein
MPEQEVINWFTTNGGRMNASVQGTNDWTRIYFPSNGSFLEVRFVQRPAQSGLLYSTNQSGLRLVVQTNGILNGVWLGKTQIARTNAP